MSPAYSWPKMNSPYAGICGMPWWMIFRSVPQTPQALTRTRTSSSPGTGTGRCWSSKRCGATSTVAVMVAGIDMGAPFSKLRRTVADKPAAGEEEPGRPRDFSTLPAPALAGPARRGRRAGRRQVQLCFERALHHGEADLDHGHRHVGIEGLDQSQRVRAREVLARLLEQGVEAERRLVVPGRRQ